MPIIRARGRFRCGFFTSAAANVTLFHASLEKSEPTSDAPNATMNAEVTSTCPTKFPLEKFAAIASAFLPMVRPSRMSSARVPVLMIVRSFLFLIRMMKRCFC